MAKLKAPTEIGGFAIDPRSPSVGEALVWDGAAYTPQPVDPGSGALFLPLAGGLMTGPIDMGGEEIQNAVIPDYLPLAGGVMTGDIDLGGNELQNAVIPGYLPLAGGTMSGHLLLDNVRLKAFNASDIQGGSVYAYNSAGREILALVGGDGDNTTDPSILIYGRSDSTSPGDIQFRDWDDAYWLRWDEANQQIIFRIGGSIGMTLDSSRDLIGPSATRGWQLVNGSGSAAAPVYSFRGDLNTGMYSNEADAVYLTAGGVAMFGLAGGTVNGPQISAVTTGTAANVNVNTTGVRVLARFTSALKYKRDLKDADHLADIELKPQRFYRPDDDREFYGFIADWIADQDPLLGTYSEEGEIENYDSPAVMAVLAAKVNRLTNRISKLEGSLLS